MYLIKLETNIVVINYLEGELPMKPRSPIVTLSLLTFLLLFVVGCASIDGGIQPEAECSESGETARRLLPWEPPIPEWLLDGDHDKLVPFPVVASILGFDDIWPSYRMVESGGGKSCLSVSSTNDSVDVYLTDSTISSILHLTSIWIIYEADRIIIMVARANDFGCGPPSPPEREFCVSENEWRNWHPDPPNVKITVANVNGRDLFLSDGYKLMPLQ